MKHSPGESPGREEDDAVDVSADGRTVVGLATTPEAVDEGFVATVPEPASAALEAACLAALAGLGSLSSRRAPSCRGSRRAPAAAGGWSPAAGP
jgi:hypothetical protein